MATAKKSSGKKASTKKAASKKAANRKSATKKSAAKTAASKKSASKKSTSRKSSGSAARSNNPSSTGHGKAKKEPAKQTSQCWPGYKPVPGKAKGTKGSCEPKEHQTSSEKKSDAMAAAGSKLRKAGGSKKRANRSK